MKPSNRQSISSESIANDQRRSFLKLLSTAGFAGLAGCNTVRELLNQEESPSRVDQQVPETDAARRYRDVFVSVEENIDTPFGDVTFDYQPIRIDPANHSDQEVTFSILRAAPSNDNSGDRMWISPSDLDLSEIEMLMKATLNIEDNIQITSDILDSEVHFSGGQNQLGIYCLIGTHQKQDAILIVRATGRTSVKALARGYEDSVVVPNA